MTPDVIIVGGGPVGLVAALAGQRAGLQPLVVERRQGVIDKACGEGLMAPGLDVLAGLNVHPPGHELRGILYADATGRHRARADLPRAGLGIRRTQLHGALLAAVHDRGIDVRYATVVDLQQDGRQVQVVVRQRNGQVSTLHAPHVIAADGLHSTVRRALGLHRPVRQELLGPPRRHGLRQHHALSPWSADVEVYWSPVGEAYVTPVSDQEVGLAFLTTTRTPLSELMASFPVLVERLQNVPTSSTVRGAGPLRQRSTRRVLGRVLLTGDAAGYVDALTGDGLSLGFQQAVAAITCIADAQTASYESAWRQITAQADRATDLLVRASSLEPVRRNLTRTLHTCPSLLSFVLVKMYQ